MPHVMLRHQPQVISDISVSPGGETQAMYFRAAFAVLLG